MDKIEIISPDKNVTLVKFSEYVAPIQSIEGASKYVRFGLKNNFPNELLRLYNEHPEHNAIIGAKARYFFGNGLSCVNESDDAFLDSIMNGANRFENFNSLAAKTVLDNEVFNSFYIQVITDLTGVPIEFYHLQNACCRLSSDGNILFYSDDFLDRKCKVVEYKEYSEGCEAGTYFMKYQVYQPTANNKEVYPLPEYKGCLKEIKSDIDVSVFNANYVSKGFSAGTLVTFFNGEPDDEKKKEIKRRFNNSLTGVENAGETVINFADKDGQAAQITAINVDDLDKKFEFITKRYQQKIITGHNITNPELFGIKNEGQLGGGSRAYLIDSHELFINTYTLPRQREYLKFFSYLIFLKYKKNIELKFNELKPIGLDLSNDADLTQDERRILKGYEPLTAPKLDTNGLPLPVEAGVNSTLTNLSGRQFQGLMRIVSKFDAGKLSKESALALMISGFGLTEIDALTFLNDNDATPDEQTNMSSQDISGSILQRLDECADVLNDDDYEILFEEEVVLNNGNDALRYELKASKMAFDVVITVKDLDSAILNSLKGNPTISVDELSKLTGKNLIDVNESLARLKKNKLIIDSSIGLTPTKKADKRESDPLDETEIRTQYYYKLSDTAPTVNANTGKTIKPRDFCKEMLEKTSAKKSWSFEKIDNLSNEFGLNLWSYRGGFFTNSTTGETTPFCRHVWAAKTIKVIKKK